MSGRRAFLGLLAGGACLALLPYAFLAGLRLSARLLPPLPLDKVNEVSALVLDRNGELLRPFTAKGGLWRLPVELKETDQRFLSLLIAYEDRRFFSHHGIDPRALLRAAAQILRRGHVVSGGSTITMQLARLLEPRTERSLVAKWWQMVRAVELEEKLSKPEILQAYLTLAPYGGNLEGVRAASLAYFGKEPRRLSIGEAALLISLPQSPQARRPDVSPKQAQQARRLVLTRLNDLHIVSAADLAAAEDEIIPSARRPVPQFAAHLAERLIAAAPQQKILRTTLDKALQTKLEGLITERVAGLGPKLSAALLVIDNETGAVRAHIGSASYLDRGRAGAIDMTLAQRSPGSTLKPFIYALAFDEGIAHPETLVSDETQRYGVYAPSNFDRGHQGTVSLRRALQQSLNLPAIELLERLSPARFLSSLRNAGASPLLPQGSVPGLAVGLGGLGITLNDLASLYTGLARQGVPVALRHLDGEPVSEHRLTGAVASWYVADILRETPPPDGMTGGRFSYKTGTSYGFRDAWALGFTRETTIAVWVGRPDNAATPGLTGRSAAAPLLFEAFARLGAGGALPDAPKDALIAHNRALPAPLRAFGLAAFRLKEARDGILGEAPLRVAFPPDGARLAHEGDEPITLKAAGGAAPLQWFIDGVPLQGDDLRRIAEWHPKSSGFARITVNDRQGASATVRIRID